jgi:hypothetical protein
MDHQDSQAGLSATIARITEGRLAQSRADAQERLVEALRSFAPDARHAATEAAMERLAKQETREAKLKAFAEELDKVD